MLIFLKKNLIFKIEEKHQSSIKALWIVFIWKENSSYIYINITSAKKDLISTTLLSDIRNLKSFRAATSSIAKICICNMPTVKKKRSGHLLRPQQRLHNNRKFFHQFDGFLRTRKTERKQSKVNKKNTYTHAYVDYTFSLFIRIIYKASGLFLAGQTVVTSEAAGGWSGGYICIGNCLTMQIRLSLSLL